jgi:hypothetical protein
MGRPRLPSVFLRRLFHTKKILSSGIVRELFERHARGRLLADLENQVFVIALNVDVLIRRVERQIAVEVDRREVLILTEGEVRSENTSDHVVEARLRDSPGGVGVKELLTKKIIRSASLVLESAIFQARAEVIHT